MLPIGETSLLTLRLAGSIAAATVHELKAALRQAQEAGTEHHRAQKQFFAAFDAALDRPTVGQRYFENEKMAEVLAGEIMMLEETGFTVHGFAILPNHAHVLLHLLASSGLSFAKALDLLHQRTGQHCRRLVRPKLPPESPFWQSGWYELPIVDEAELPRALAYLRGNARRAGLPQRYQAWPYVSEQETAFSLFTAH